MEKDFSFVAYYNFLQGLEDWICNFLQCFTRQIYNFLQDFSAIVEENISEISFLF